MYTAQRMTPTTHRCARCASPRAAARFLGMSDTHSARMAIGKVAIPPPIAMLLEVLVAHDITPEEALKLVGVNVGKAARQARSEQVNKAPRFF
jgi:DNA-binding transcriptional regulator YdaS (Cro superfamily)